MERSEGNDNAQRRREGHYHYLRASEYVVETEISYAIIVSVHDELCPIKYLSLKN